MADKELDQQKRRFLVAATGVAGGIATVAAAVPFVGSMWPSERAKAAGAPVEADISQLAPGEKMTVEWRGQPVWIVRRTPQMLDDIKQSDPKVADPDSKRNYDSTIALKGPNTLKVQGCAFGGMFCGGQTWKRVS